MRAGPLVCPIRSYFSWQDRRPNDRTSGAIVLEMTGPILNHCPCFWTIALSFLNHCPLLFLMSFPYVFPIINLVWLSCYDMTHCVKTSKLSYHYTTNIFLNTLTLPTRFNYLLFLFFHYVHLFQMKSNQNDIKIAALIIQDFTR